MACTGLQFSEIEEWFSDIPCEKRCYQLANNILDYVKEIELHNNYKIQVKIGIHCGPVIAGVVGYHKP